MHCSADTAAWRHGAAGERRTARLLSQLERQGWVVLHDLAVAGSRANIDHLVIRPGGVFVSRPDAPVAVQDLEMHLLLAVSVVR